MNTETRILTDTQGSSRYIEQKTVMHYPLAHYRIRSLAALGLAVTTGVIMAVLTLISAL